MTVEQQAIKHMSKIADTKRVRDFLRLMSEGHTLHPQDNGYWECKKPDGTMYLMHVTEAEQVCDCPARGICAHIHAVWVLQGIVPMLRPTDKRPVYEDTGHDLPY